MNGCNQNTYNDYYTEFQAYDFDSQWPQSNDNLVLESNDNFILNISTNNQQDNFNSPSNPPENSNDDENFYSLEFDFNLPQDNDKSDNENFQQENLTNSFTNIHTNNILQPETTNIIHNFNPSHSSFYLLGNPDYEYYFELQNPELTNKIKNIFNENIVDTNINYRDNKTEKELSHPSYYSISSTYQSIDKTNSYLNNFQSPGFIETYQIEQDPYSLITTRKRKNTFLYENHVSKKRRKNPNHKEQNDDRQTLWTLTEESNLLKHVLSIIDNNNSKTQIATEYIDEYKSNRSVISVCKRLDEIIGLEWNNKNKIQSEIDLINFYNTDFNHLKNSEQICKHAKPGSYQPTKSDHNRFHKWSEEDAQFLKACCIENKHLCNNWNQLSKLILQKHPQFKTKDVLRMRLINKLFPNQTYQSFLRS